jgi:hypothetical protein
MKITIELDTSYDKQEKINEIIDALKSEGIPSKIPTIGGRVPPFEVVPSKKPKLDKEEYDKLFSKIKDDVNEEDKKKGSRRPRQYSYELKKNIISFVKLHKSMHPDSTMKKIGKIIDVNYTTFCDWLKGQKLNGVGKKPKSIKGRGLTRWGRTYEEVNERNKKIVDYLNKNPYISWEEVGEKFGLSSTLIYSIAKKSGKVRIMKREWEKLVEPTYKKIEPIKEEVKVLESPAEHFLKFENSRKDVKETIGAINECIIKGSLSYKDDADKFGFDRRMLPPPEWYGFITEVAQKVNRLMGIEVILSPTLSGIIFKK